MTDIHILPVSFLCQNARLRNCLQYVPGLPCICVFDLDCLGGFNLDELQRQRVKRDSSFAINQQEVYSQR